MKFEEGIKAESREKDVITYDEMSNIADRFAIYESNELIEAIRFLNDLGSLQYFEKVQLKDKIVINPQVFSLTKKKLFFLV